MPRTVMVTPTLPGVMLTGETMSTKGTALAWAAGKKGAEEKSTSTK